MCNTVELVRNMTICGGAVTECSYNPRDPRQPVLRYSRYIKHSYRQLRRAEECEMYGNMLYYVYIV